MRKLIVLLVLFGTCAWAQTPILTGPALKKADGKEIYNAGRYATIQAAVLAAKGKHLYVPSGTYSGLTLDSSYDNTTIWLGDSVVTTGVWHICGNGPDISALDANYSTDTGYVENITIKGTLYLGDGGRLGSFYCKNVSVDNVVGGDSTKGVHIYAHSDNVHIGRVYIEGTKVDNAVTGGVYIDKYDTVTSSRPRAITIGDIYVGRGHYCGVYIEGEDVSIGNVVVDTAGLNGFRITNSYNVNVGSVSVRKSGYSTANATTTYIHSGVSVDGGAKKIHIDNIYASQSKNMNFCVLNNTNNISVGNIFSDTASGDTAVYLNSHSVDIGTIKVHEDSAKFGVYFNNGSNVSVQRIFAAGACFGVRFVGTGNNVQVGGIYARQCDTAGVQIGTQANYRQRIQIGSIQTDTCYQYGTYFNSVADSGNISVGSIQANGDSAAPYFAGLAFNGVDGDVHIGSASIVNYDTTDGRGMLIATGNDGKIHVENLFIQKCSTGIAHTDTASNDGFSFGQINLEGNGTDLSTLFLADTLIHYGFINGQQYVMGEPIDENRRPADGEILKYEADSGKWLPSTDATAAAGSGIDSATALGLIHDTGAVLFQPINTVDSDLVGPIVRDTGDVRYAPILPDSTEIDTANIREWVADKVGGMVTGNTESDITVTYQDADNTFDFAVGNLEDLPSASDDTVSMFYDNGSGTILKLGPSTEAGHVLQNLGAALSPPYWDFVDSLNIQSGALAWSNLSTQAQDSARAGSGAGIWTEVTDSTARYLANDTVIAFRADDDTTHIEGQNQAFKFNGFILADSIIALAAGLSTSDSMRINGRLYFGSTGSVYLDSALADSVISQTGRFAQGAGSTDSFYVAQGDTTVVGWKQSGDTIFVDTTSGAGGGNPVSIDTGGAVVAVDSTVWDTLGALDLEVVTATGFDTVKIDIADGGVLTAHIATSAVDSTKIAENSVLAPEIAAGAVGSSEIAANAVDTSDLAHAPLGKLIYDSTLARGGLYESMANVDTSHWRIAYDSSQFDFLRSNEKSATATLADSALTVSDQVVTYKKIDSTNSRIVVTSIKIDTIAIGADTVTTIAGGGLTVTLGQLSVGIGGKYLSLTDDTIHLDLNSIDSTVLTENSVLASEIAAGAVGTSEIANGTVASGDLATGAKIDSATTALGVRTAAGASTTAAGEIVHNSTTNRLWYGSGGGDPSATGVATTSDLAAFADDTTAMKAAKDSVAAWDNGAGFEKYADSGTYQEVPKSVVNTKIVIGNASDTATADSTVATIGKAKDLIGDSLATLSTNQQFIGDVWTYGISAEANKAFDLSFPYMYFPLPDTLAKIPLPAHYMRKLAADSVKHRYTQVHPAVAHIPWGDEMGWTYHVLTTPYPTSAYENICYYVSNDMGSFYQYIDTAGDTVHNPIYSGIADTLWSDSTWSDGQGKLRQVVMKPGWLGWDTAGYLSDPHLMYDALGKKWIGFRGSYIYTSAPDTFCLYVVHFDSMLSKRPPTLVWKSGATDDGGAYGSSDSLDGWALSPSWWLDDTSTVKMLFIEQDTAAGPDADEINDWVLASAPDYDYGETADTNIVVVDSVWVDTTNASTTDSVRYIVTQGEQACTTVVVKGAAPLQVVNGIVATINATMDSCRAAKIETDATDGSYGLKTFTGTSDITYSAYRKSFGNWYTLSGYHVNGGSWNDTAYFYDATSGWTVEDTIHPTTNFWHASFKRVAPRQILGLGTTATASGMMKAAQSFDAGATWTFPTDTLMKAGKSKYLTVAGMYRSDFWIREGGRLGILAGFAVGDTQKVGVTYSQILPFDTLQMVAKETDGPYITGNPAESLVVQSAKRWVSGSTEPRIYMDSATGGDGTDYIDTTDWIVVDDIGLIWDSVVVIFKTNGTAGSAYNYLDWILLYKGVGSIPTTLAYTVKTTDTANANWTRLVVALPSDSLKSTVGTWWRLNIRAAIKDSAGSRFIKYALPPQLIGHKRYWRDPNVPRR